MDKPVGLVTASADGQQGHAQMKLIVQTLGARLSEEAELVIAGIKGKFDARHKLLDSKVSAALSEFAEGFKKILIDI